MKSTTCGHAETSVTDSFFGTRCAKYNSKFCCCGECQIFFKKHAENIVEEFEMVPPGPFSERICEKIADVSVPPVDVHEITNAI